MSVAKTAEMGCPLTAAWAAFLANSSFSSGLEGGVIPRLVGVAVTKVIMAPTAPACRCIIGVLGSICLDFFTRDSTVTELFLAVLAAVFSGGQEVVLFFLAMAEEFLLLLELILVAFLLLTVELEEYGSRTSISTLRLFEPN